MQAFRFQAGQSAPQMDLLPPERAPRSRAAPTTRRADVVDAEFETVAFPTRRPNHRVFNDNRTNFSPRPPMTAREEQISVGGLLVAMLAEAASHLERLLARVPPAAFAGLVAALCGIAFLLVTFASADAAKPSGLAITDVATRLGDANGMRVVSVYGAVENHTDELQTVPVIEINVVADGRSKTAARILSGASILAPGESRPFAARLPHAGGKLPEVTVSFGKPGAPAR
ncbi:MULTISPECIES: hypothetical protein [unclassified Rhizobium]|uniref:hypothetical protein n=1 Tax=unclassified Rhizobium TaxID=2613769 RepID=UPI0006F64CE3|nr:MULTISPECIES: hypothetical protein [unclassified Rhizobium]KQV35215.1 hypothetical protein ASC86_13515 [Rhizobium sp. Root1212]KRD25021.1 hypothetical protein ASE37_13510 [Rhizobium sp. Root268]